jgi:hypothetical protein
VPQEPANQPPTSDDLEPDGTRADPLALLASYVMKDGRLRVPGLVVVDLNGIERVVIEADDRSATIGLRVARSWSPVGNTQVVLFAEDGNDDDLNGQPPQVGVDIRAGGNAAISARAALTSKNGVMGAGDPDIHLFPWDDRHPNP